MSLYKTRSMRWGFHSDGSLSQSDYYHSGGGMVMSRYPLPQFGKWYVEIKENGGQAHSWGLYTPTFHTDTGEFDDSNFYKTCVCMYSGGSEWATNAWEYRTHNNSIPFSPSISYTDGTGVGALAIDMDNHTVDFAGNNSWADYTWSFQNPSYNLRLNPEKGVHVIWINGGGGGGDNQFINGGQGDGSTNYISTESNDENGNGVFEYAPPAGYLAIDY